MLRALDGLVAAAKEGVRFVDSWSDSARSLGGAGFSGEAPATLPLTRDVSSGSWLHGRSVLIAAGIFFAAMIWPFVRRGENSEFIVCYVRAAQRMQARERIHRDEMTAYAYPPAMAMFSMPLARLSTTPCLAAWYAINVAATIVVVAGAWRLMGGPSLARLHGAWAAVFWLAVLLAFRFVSAPMENQQFDTVIAALLLIGCLHLWRGRDLQGAAWLGAAAAMKCTPLLFAPYLLWRGRVKAACLMAVVAVGLNRLPDFFWPQPDGQSYLGDWAATFLVKVGRSAPGVWDSDLVLNQSLSGLFNRFAQSGLALSADQLPTGMAVLAPETVSWIRWLTYGASLLLLVAVAWRMGSPGRSWASESADDSPPLDWSRLQLGVEASAVFCLMLLLSPMSSKAHYVVLVLPALMFSRAVVEGRRLLRAFVPLLIVAGPLTSKGLTGKALGDLTLAWGFPTWYVLAALWGMCLLLPATRPMGALKSARESSSNRAA